MYCTRSLRTLFLILVTLALVPLSSAQSSADKKRAKALLDRGDVAYRSKNFSEAVKLYGDALAVTPSNAYAHFWKANAHYELKEYAAAESSYSAALSHGFKPLEVYKVRWSLFFDQKNYDAAISDINKALEVEPRNSLLLRGLGDSHRQTKRYPEALSAYQRAGSVAPRDGDPNFYIARVHADMGDAPGQLMNAEEAIRKGTRHMGEAYYLVGDGYERQKRSAEAASAYERAIAANPLKYESYGNLAAIHHRQGRLKDAISVMERARAAINSEGRIFTELAWLYSLADRHTDAVGSARGAIKLLPNEYLGYTNLCRALNDVKQHQQAVTACNEALRRTPQDGETHYYLGRANDFLKRSAEATRQYKQAVVGLTSRAAKEPDSPEVFYLLGNALFSDGQREQAVFAFQRAIELSPNFARARANLGRIFVAQGNKERALGQYRILASQDSALAAQLKTAIDQMK